ncbi:hypothetical protein AVEN_235615-1 [Araneus ventricosus]|uniref:Uncharacterized protein n=1 Tax=Araneus ventricosus TaxID=182803 RepID=A0A4Y2BQN6_ARAVE|nr:hypothetical protein AVEN_235615-1 [Araneus ventricosus]
MMNRPAGPMDCEMQQPPPFLSLFRLKNSRHVQNAHLLGFLRVRPYLDTLAISVTGVSAGVVALPDTSATINRESLGISASDSASSRTPLDRSTVAGQVSKSLRSHSGPSNHLQSKSCLGEQSRERRSEGFIRPGTCRQFSDEEIVPITFTRFEIKIDHSRGSLSSGEPP